MLTILLSCCSWSHGEEVRYWVKFQGIQNSEVLNTLRNASQLVSLKDNAPDSLTALRRRADDDTGKLLKTLHYFAYYDASISYRIENMNERTYVIIQIEPGTEYHFANLQIQWVDKEGEETTPPELTQTIKIKDLELSPETAALTQSIFDAEKILSEKLRNQGFPFASVHHHEAHADLLHKTIAVTFYAQTGPSLHFGELHVNGHDKVSESFIQKRVAWKQGDLYQFDVVEQTQRSLLDSGLFSSVTIHSNPSTVDKLLPITITVSERKHRSVGAGLSFSTHQGFGASAEWENRNIMGRGEKLNLLSDISENKQQVGTTFHKPDFLRKNQDLFWILKGAQESTKSYMQQTVNLTALIKRKINESTDYSFGLKIEQDRNTRTDNDSHLTLMSVPLNYSWRSTDKLLDPTKGQVINVSLTPFTQVNSNLRFLIDKISWAYYSPLTSSHDLTFSGWTSLASVSGASRIDIPAPHRLYGGSEKMLRGYGYQTVSPLDGQNNPVGGRSLMVYGAELNWYFNKNCSTALFYELGQVFEESLPRFDKKLLRSWGVGAHYHSFLGTVKLDIAFPIDRRPNLDQSYQVYLSIGPNF
ncbi:MAG: translocation and assembly module TamA [Halioglobus sp.]|jgi:translocation and assembly module TamA